MPDPVIPVVLDLADERATAMLAEDIAMVLAPGDAVALSGGLGAGKTTLARALIRALADDPELEVPSPTFTLVQTYPGRLEVAHFDLYRIGDIAELDEIGFEPGAGVMLVEWPERAGDRLPAGALRVDLAIAGTGRRAAISGAGDWPERIARSRAVRDFLDRAGWSGAARRHLQGDASTRRYERVRCGGSRGVLMNAPARPDGPPVRDGKPYSRIAHLAEDVRPFVAVGEALRAAGLSAPELYDLDLPAGLLLLEDLGGEGIAVGGVPDPERYRAAVEVLAAIHAEPRPSMLPLPGASGASSGGPADSYALPSFDSGAMGIEVALLLDWYAPHATGARLPPEAGAEFHALWQALFGRLASAETSWVLRDFHSPNLLWLAERHGVRRIGLLDYQDALVGPAAYDLASLLQDARVTVPESLERALFDHYVAVRRGRDPEFDRAALAEACAIMAAQRATKVLGIFARLAGRDGKPHYLRHIPRLRKYLLRSLSHPVLSGLALWYERRLPLA